jgi:hypothetical protein
MHTRRWLLMIVVVGLLIGLAPARAEEKPVIVDKGRNVYLVDASRGEINNLLPGEDVEKISRLQNEEASVGAISPVSPDDQAIFAVVGETFGFLSIQDGTFEPLNPQRLFTRFVPIVSLMGITPWGWRNERTLVGVGIELVDLQKNEFNPALVTIDRLTGAVGGTALPRELLKMAPVSLSPNGSRLLLLARPQPDEDGPPGMARMQVTWPHAASPRLAALPESIRRQTEDLAQRLDYGRMLLELRPLLAPGDEEVAATTDRTRLMLYDTADGGTRELRSFDPALMSIGFAWSQDAARLAASFTGALDYR